MKWKIKTHPTKVLNPTSTAQAGHAVLSQQVHSLDTETTQSKSAYIC